MSWGHPGSGIAAQEWPAGSRSPHPVNLPVPAHWPLSPPQRRPQLEAGELWLGQPLPRGLQSLFILPPLRDQCTPGEGWPWPGGCGADAQGSPVRGLGSGLASGAWVTGQLWSLWNANPRGLAAGASAVWLLDRKSFPTLAGLGASGWPAGDRASAAAHPAVASCDSPSASRAEVGSGRQLWPPHSISVVQSGSPKPPRAAFLALRCW